jgi:hypothetical protein
MKKFLNVWKKFTKRDSILDEEINRFINSDNYSLLYFFLDRKNSFLNEQYIQFCKKRICYEIVEFIYDCKEYKNLFPEEEEVNFQITEQILLKCNYIYSIYIEDDSLKQMNISHKCKHDIETIQKSEYKLVDIRDIFDSAVEHVSDILVVNTIKDFIVENNLSQFITESSLSTSRRTLSNLDSNILNSSSTSRSTSRSTSISNSDSNILNSSSRSTSISNSDLNMSNSTSNISIANSSSRSKKSPSLAYNHTDLSQDNN